MHANAESTMYMLHLINLSLYEGYFGLGGINRLCYFKMRITWIDNCFISAVEQISNIRREERKINALII